MTAFRYHPACELFPLMAKEQLEAMAADIKERGQVHPVVIWKRKRVVVDGRNRIHACGIAGVKVRTVEKDFANDWEVAQFVASTNLQRRQLSYNQRAILGVDLKKQYEPAKKQASRANLKRGTKAPEQANSPSREQARDEAAAAVNVGGRAITAAEKVLTGGTSELVAAVKDDTIPINMAEAVAKLPADEQRWIVKRIRSEAASNVPQARRQLEEEKRAVLAKKQAAPATARLIVGDALGNLEAFAGAHCIVTDPPYGIDTHRTREGGQDYADGADYALELLDKVCAGLVPLIAPDAHLYVFSGYSYLAAFKAILARHFDVQDNPIVWVKKQQTMCDYSQWYGSKHEYVIFARQRGSKRPLVNGAVGDVFEAGRGTDTTHSAEKPVLLLERFIEQSTAVGELIGDPFTGSGSTGVAALKLRRAFVGTELDPKWAATADARMKGVAAA